MKVNTKSWHYRFNLKVGGDAWKIERKNTLCSYFWFTMWNAFKVFLCAFAVVFVIALMGAGLTEPNVAIGMWVLSIVGYKAVAVAIMGILGWLCFALAAVCIFGFGYAITYLVNEYKIRKVRKESTKPTKEPGLIVSFIKAKKAKVCPMIEFVRDEK